MTAPTNALDLTPLRVALRKIYDNDSGVQATTNRKERNLRARGAEVHHRTMPLMTYFVVSAPESLGTRGRRDVNIQFEAWVCEREGHEDDSFLTLEALMSRAEELFVGSVLSKEGIDISRPRVVNRQDNMFPDFLGAGRKDCDCVRSIRADFRFVYTWLPIP